MSLIHNATFDSQTRVLSLLDKAGNVISSCEVPSKGNVDDITKPLTFRATQDGSTVKLTKNGSPTGSFQTSRDGGNTWEDYTIDTVITLNTGDEVSFRAKSDRTSGQTNTVYFQFEMTGKIEAWHNVMSLYRTNDFATYDTVVKFAFYRLFNECASLTKAPVLPATTLAESCYHGIFRACASLTEAPALPATVLVKNCYFGMFVKCTSLIKAPELPATRLASGCYREMFMYCASLTKAPALPATTLSYDCYWYMFGECASLTKAPALPATTLDLNCYKYMFENCQSLKEVRISATTTATDALSYWLSGVSATGDFYCDPNATIFPTDSASGIPAGWNRIPKPAPAPTVDDVTKPLTFKATQDGSTVKLTKHGSPVGDFQTSSDGGNTWTDYTIDTAIALNNGDEVSFRAKADRTSAQTESSYFYFIMTGNIEAWHNVMSMLRTNDFATYKSVVGYAFSCMFNGCSSLTKAPVLPATILADSCYWDMFANCLSLTEAPELPAIALAEDCYYGMFRSCHSLTKAPELPATTLFIRCYYSMFDGCWELTKAPVLPATTLDSYCYQYMFQSCQSLTKAPALPATKLSYNCYYYMFSGCQSLKEVRVSATTTATNALEEWLYGVSATGDFYCDPSSTIFPTDSASGIPANWSRKPLADYPVTP